MFWYNIKIVVCCNKRGRCTLILLWQFFLYLFGLKQSRLPPIAGGGGGKCAADDGCLGPGDPRPYSLGLGGIIIAYT